MILKIQRKCLEPYRYGYFAQPFVIVGHFKLIRYRHSMNTIIRGTSTTGSAVLRVGNSLLKSGISRASGSRSGDNFFNPKKIYTLEEKRGALGRHTVARQKISPANLLGLGSAGGIAGAALGETAWVVTGCSWTTVAAMSAIGSATFLAVARATNKPMAPLDNAMSELAELVSYRSALDFRYTNNPDQQFDEDEIYTMKVLSERYKEPIVSFKLLWDLHFTSRFENDHELFLKGIFKELLIQKLSNREIMMLILQISEMAKTHTSEDVKSLPAFQRLSKRSDIPPQNHDDIARLIDIFTIMLEPNDPKPRGLDTYNLYQNLCREKYEFFKFRITEDERQLTEDIRILNALEKEKVKEKN